MAASPEYWAGVADAGRIRVVVLEDRHRFRAVFAETDFPITRATSDLVAVELLKAGAVDRTGVVLSGMGSGPPDPQAIVGVIARAMLKMDAATVAVSDVISVRSLDGSCVASFYPVRAGGCKEGTAAHGRIRASFHMIDPPHGLQARGAETREWPVQAVAIGKAATILALGGEVAKGRFDAPGRIVVPFANDSGPAPSEGVEAAVAGVLKRVR